MAPKLLRCSTHDDEIAVMKLKFHLDRMIVNPP
jgi:hypothetical protein